MALVRDPDEEEKTPIEFLDVSAGIFARHTVREERTQRMMLALLVLQLVGTTIILAVLLLR